MFLYAEKLEDFFEMIEAESEKEKIPVFIGKTITTDETGMTLGEIVLQYQFDTDMIVSFRTSEGVDPVLLPNRQFFTALQYFASEEEVKKTQDKTQQMMKAFEEKVNAEFEKAKLLLKNKGFKIIIPYIWNE